MIQGSSHQNHYSHHSRAVQTGNPTADGPGVCVRKWTAILSVCCPTWAKNVMASGRGFANEKRVKGSPLPPVVGSALDCSEVSPVNTTEGNQTENIRRPKQDDVWSGILLNFPWFSIPTDVPVLSNRETHFPTTTVDHQQEQAAAPQGILLTSLWPRGQILASKQCSNSVHNNLAYYRPLQGTERSSIHFLFLVN